MGKGAAVNEETLYEAAEKRLGVPPVRERGRDMENPPELSCWQWVSLGHLELMMDGGAADVLAYGCPPVALATSIVQ